MFKNYVRILLIGLFIGNYAVMAQYSIVGDLMTDFGDTGYCSSSDTSDDGNRVIVSSTNADLYLGGVKVFEYNTKNNQWEQLGQTISWNVILASFGYDVSISGDGNTIAIGVTGTGGRVFTYRLQNGTWTSIGSEIYGKEGAQIGTKVILNTDGSKLIVGGTGMKKSYRSYGGVMLFQLDEGNNTWNQIGDTIMGDKIDGFFGVEIAISSDFNSMVIGSLAGKVKVYDLSDEDDIWKQRGNTIASAHNEDYHKSWFGSRVAISDDGNYIVIGAPTNSLGVDDFADTPPGYVQGYKFNGTDWLPYGSKLTTGQKGDCFGYSIALDPKGKRLVVGRPKSAWNDYNNPGVHIYDYDGNNWVYRYMLTANADKSRFGTDVYITPDKSRIIVSGINNVLGVYQDSKELGLENRLDSSDTHITLYPNPVKSSCTITLSNSASRDLKNKECVLEIMDNVGRTVITKNNINIDSSLYVSTEHLHTGIYFVRIKDSEGSQVYVKRIVKR